MKNDYNLNESELTELTLLVEHGPISYYHGNEKNEIYKTKKSLIDKGFAVLITYNTGGTTSVGIAATLNGSDVYKSIYNHSNTIEQAQAYRLNIPLSRYNEIKDMSPH